MKQQFLLVIIFISYSSIATSQILFGFETRWSDDFREWTIFTDDEEKEGNLNMRWQQQMDWSEWDYRIGESTGSIKLKFKNDPSVWEVRGDGEIITMRMKWNNDVNEWTISDGSTKITLKAAYNNNLNDWKIVENKFGTFELFMEWQDDPRNWTVIDEMDKKISLPFRMALSFLGIIHSIPKN
ncbi:MAG: hypothetical protein P8M17_04560 [Saprospiraceae bacterium]|nr:hypothetical protein [Saprospiraceae bacterium]MDG1435531.1 hypothetical protein [Saprospiraceae bacterium]MDG2418241.1 hypothetical protein [Saprospiraceae bacterium]